MPYTQKGRICSISSPLGDDVLLLRRLRGEEEISKPFRFVLDMISEKKDIIFEDIIGKKLTVSMKLANGKERYFNGAVARFSQGDTVGRFTAYRAEIVPWLWFLTRGNCCRIFQHMTPTKIVEQIFGELAGSNFENQQTAPHPEREYCVQYRESDFNFVSRLMEEEGVAYYFKHDQKEHTLVLFDSPSGNIVCPGQNRVAYATAKGEGNKTGEIEEWDVGQELRAGRYAYTDYNFESPSTNLMTDTSSSIRIGGNESYEIYDYPGFYGELAEGDRRVRLRMEAEETASIEIRGRGYCGAFSPGHFFNLSGHPRTSYNDQYLVSGIVHEVTQGVGYESDSEAESHYSNEFTCVPYAVPYRPRQTTTKPFVHGVQTATVVGASGNEIDVDKYGRIVVQFHWDREGKSDEKSSCRIRVAQNWAGKNWGLIAHPRIGQEVVIDFLEGDPDRPIVVGRVYNAEQMPPYELPANATQTGIKSRSSKKGTPDNFNEIRMEDKKGEELFYVHAEKDREKQVENDELESVGHDRTRSVGNDETVTIGNNRKVEVGTNHDESVGSDETLSVGKDRSRNVGATETIDVGKNQILTINESRNLTVGKDQTISIAKDQDETIGGEYQTTVAKEYLLQAKKIQLVAKNELSIKVGSAELVMKKNGDISIEGKKISVKGSGDVILKGSKISQN